ncbi:Hsp20/alpha crystallin family protein [Kineobactrum salinum]|uniref:Hsp20/alpha crystallin family protein n=1 Tax=Kineobactrum salinum TaxID=2708301 RepID=A0A6C0U501_9GAMM|nr:Hsp20/alpha crystallin family protein [Kineobactrum salinum]QIB67240.1 Hsp20/alpha crystallin family protein [Kineobactrum salinum]
MSSIQRNNTFDLGRFFDEFWAPTSASDQMGTFFSPRVDVREQGEHYEITAELPGVNKEDIHVHVREGTLTLEAEASQSQQEEKEGRVIRQERRYGKYMRSFDLGGDVRDEDIKASFKDGVLTLQVPKVRAQAQEARRIEIQ